MRLSLIAVAAVCITIAGCGGGKAKVKGKVVENSQPMTFGANEGAIELMPMGPDGKPDKSKMFTAVVNEDGSFEVVSSGGEVPPGEYEVAFRGFGKLPPKYKAFPPVKRELKPGSNEIIIDLAKPE